MPGHMSRINTTLNKKQIRGSHLETFFKLRDPLGFLKKVDKRAHIKTTPRAEEPDTGLITSLRMLRWLNFKQGNITMHSKQYWLKIRSWNNVCGNLADRKKKAINIDVQNLTVTDLHAFINYHQNT